MLQRGSSAARRGKVRSSKRLVIEQLESRELFSGDAAATIYSPEWFATCLDSNATRHAQPAGISVRSAMSSSAATSSVLRNTYDWIVQFDTNSLGGIDSVAQTESLLADSGLDFDIVRGLGARGTVLVRTYGASAITVSAALRADADVDTFERDGVQQFSRVPGDPSFSQNWGLRNTGQSINGASGGTAGADIDAAAAWDISTGSRNVVVAVIDTGVDYNHVDLAANMWTNAGEIAGNGIDDDGNGFVDDVHGVNFITDTGNPMDDNGHGTHVAGTIGAVGNNGIGVAGVNWNVSIMALKFLSASGSGWNSDAIQAINYMTLMKTQYGVNVCVANNSWGGGGYDSTLSNAISAAGRAGILFVAAAGNSATNNDASPQYPANYRLANVLSVASTDRWDQLSSFSCYGSRTVDVAAPGSTIYSTLPGNRYGYLSGTSMATPHATGLAALAWAANPNATMAQIRDAIVQGVDQLPSLAGKTISGGRINALKTLQLIAGVAPTPTPDPDPQPSPTPVIATLVATPGNLPVGGTVALTASGVQQTGGTITGVSFYIDSNGNGGWDSGDLRLGSTTAVVSGQAAIALDTSSMAVGNYTLLARAQGSDGQWSDAVSTTLTLVATDDHGDTPGVATLVSVGATTAGAIGSQQDVDFFQFTAVAGKTYILQTTLGTLHDSVLTLFDRNGLTVLAQNDDLATGNYASRITWTATASGTFYAAVTSYMSSGIGSYDFQVSTPNAAPRVTAQSNLTIRNGGSATVTLRASDPDGDPMTFQAQAYGPDPVAQQAYDLDRTLGLSRNVATVDNARGWQEKYFTGANRKTYFITPNGTVYELRNSRNISQSRVVARLSSAYYANTNLLCSATQPGSTLLSPSQVSLSVSGNRLTVRAVNYVGRFMVQWTASDGKASTASSFYVNATGTLTASRSLASSAAQGVDSLLASGGMGGPQAEQIDSGVLTALHAAWTRRS